MSKLTADNDGDMRLNKFRAFTNFFFELSSLSEIDKKQQMQSLLDLYNDQNTSVNAWQRKIYMREIQRFMMNS